MAFQNYRDAFTLENYPPDESGYSEIPLEHIFDYLEHTFPNGYVFEPVTAGYSPNGCGFFVGKLQITDGDGFISVPGSANGTSPEMSMAGLASVALRNAVLRWLGAGRTIYVQNSEAQTKEAAVAPPQATYQPSAQSGGYRAGGGFQGRSGGGQSQRPWDGGVKVKSGQYINTAYRDLPQEVVEQWANNGNEVAKLEATRRQTAAPSGGTSQPRNPFR